MRPDWIDELNALRAGMRHGRDVGECNPVDAERILRGWGRHVSHETVDLFCAGSRAPNAYLASFMVARP